MGNKTSSFALMAVAALAACLNSDRQPADDTVTATASEIPASQAPVAGDRLIDATGVGPVKLGMTLEVVRKTLPSAKIERTSDGEGVALVEITIAPGSAMTVYTGEENPEAQINLSRSIILIETFSETFNTAERVHPGSPVSAVEKIYGKTKSVDMSEIESREYITFERQPDKLTFRLDRMGMLPNDSGPPRNAGTQGIIFSISVSSR